MVTVIQERDQQNPWAGIAEKGITNAVKGYTERSDEMALKRSIESLGDDADPRDVMKAIMRTNTYGREAKDSALKNYMGMENFNLAQKKAANEEKRLVQQERVTQAQAQIAANKEERAKEEALRKAEEFQMKKTEKEQDRIAADNMLDQTSLPEETKQSLRGTLTRAETAKLLTEELKPANATEFEKKYAAKQADKAIELENDIEKTKQAIGSIEYARKLANDLGPTGWFTGALGLSEKGAELEAMGLTMLEPIFKVLNPGGGILAAYKVKEVQKLFGIKASDAPWLKTAKLNALERFAKIGLDRAEQRLQLIMKHGGKPSPEIEKFDKESEMLQDALIDYDFTATEVNLPELPSPKQFMNKTVTSPEGKKYYSDGTRWVEK
jgi:hypothetical protein